VPSDLDSPRLIAVLATLATAAFVVAGRGGRYGAWAARAAAALYTAAMIVALFEVCRWLVR
jgi:hypothetical protein